MVVTLFQRAHPIAPAQIDRGKFLDAVDEIGLSVELLEVDEGGPFVPLLRQQIELIKLRGAVKDLADVPHHALVDHAAADAEPVPVFQRALGKADRARTLTDPVGIVEQRHGLTALRQINRKRQPDRPGADHHNRVFSRIGAGPVLVGVAAITELGFGLLRHALNVALAKGLDPA